MPLTPTMLLIPSAMPALVGREGVGDDRRRVGEQAGRADPLHDPEHDQVGGAGAAGQPVDGQEQRGDRVDDEAEVVDADPAVHVAEPAEADDEHARDDEEAEDHPQQVEAVGRDERVEMDAAEDGRHRDQRDRARRASRAGRRASRSTARSTCSGRRGGRRAGAAAGARVCARIHDKLYRQPEQFACRSRVWSAACRTPPMTRICSRATFASCSVSWCAGCAPSTASRSPRAPFSVASIAKAPRSIGDAGGRRARAAAVDGADDRRPRDATG